MPAGDRSSLAQGSVKAGVIGLGRGLQRSQNRVSTKLGAFHMAAMAVEWPEQVEWV